MSNSQDDERRLFYVALTRAKESVTITHANEGDGGRETLPSQFIEEIHSELVQDIDTKKWEEKFKKDKSFQFKDVANSAVAEFATISKGQKEFVRGLFDKQGFSSTALNNYLECPWKYFYVNLVRIPSAQTIHQVYGTAIHGALADYGNKIKTEDVNENFLLSAYEGWLNRLPVSPRDLEILLEKGKKALFGWYKEYKNAFENPTSLEYRINDAMIDDSIRLTGVLDKMEFVTDEIVRVVDYKTGKPKSRNQLMGKTKDADGNYYRQLTFYKLLLKYHKDGIYNMQEGVIDFIEPDDKGKYHKEIFEITDEEIKNLEEIIRSVSNEILNLEFLDKKCSTEDCEYCRLRSLLNKK